MKNLKYRIWDKWEKKMLYPREAMLRTWKDETCDPDNEYDFHSRRLILDPNGEVCVYDDEHGFYGNPTSKDGQRYEALLFAGLKAIGDRDVYEEDIVKLAVRYAPYPGADEEEMEINYLTGVIKFESGGFWFICPYIFNENCHFHYNTVDREVIGNTRENPELVSEGFKNGG